MSISNIPDKVNQSIGSVKHHESFVESLVRKNVEDLKSVAMWRGCIAECVGVFLLTFFTIGVGISHEKGTPAPILQIAIGCGFFVAVIISTLSTVSGGHVNPAISIGFLVANQITFVRFVMYSIFHVVGSIAGAWCLQAILPKEYEGFLGLIQPGHDITDAQAVSMEIVITALLLFGTISFIDKHREDIQGSIPLMVGLIVIVNILTAGNVSGGAMNPARATGSAVIVQNYEKLWIYWAGPMVGGALGALLYTLFFSTRPIPIIRRAELSTRYTRPSVDDENEEEFTDLNLNDNTKLSA